MLITRDHSLAEAIQSTAAAIGVSVQQVRESELIRSRWSSASVVLVGADSGAFTLSLGLPPRPGVHVVGADADSVLTWSVPLAAPGLVLPAQSGFLSVLLTGQTGGDGPPAQLLRVLGGSGGVGASTLSAALAQRLAARGRSCVLVETDWQGGGIDLLFGAENEPGWRWNDLRAAVGSIGNLHGHLPNVLGVDLVSCGGALRSPAQEAPELTPPDSAVRAVLQSLCRTHEVIVVDAGRHASLPAGLAARQSTILMVAAQVRGVVAARSCLRANGLVDAQLVVRTGPGLRLDPSLVAETLGLSLLGQVCTDTRLPWALEAGEPPVRVHRRRYARQVDFVLDRLVEGAAS